MFHIADIPRLMTDCKFTAGMRLLMGVVEYVLQLIINDVAPGGETEVHGRWCWCIR